MRATNERENADLLAFNLKRLRKRAKLTQEELARNADVSRSAVAAIERGRYASARIPTLKALADALSAPVTEFFRKPRVAKAA